MRRSIYLALTVVSLAATVDGILFRRLRDAELAADEAATSLDACQVIGRRIEQHRERKEIVSTETEVKDIASYVERTAKGVGLAADAIVFIEPGAAKPIEGTPLAEQLIHLEIERSPLEKLGSFLLELETSAPSLRIVSVRMIEPREPGSSELWNCEVNLTQTTLSVMRQ